MATKKIDPFRRRMGAKDDLIAEQFVPTEDYKARQMEVARRLIAAGLNPEEIASMFLVPYDLLLGEKPNDMECRAEQARAEAEPAVAFLSIKNETPAG